MFSMLHMLDMKVNIIQTGEKIAKSSQQPNTEIIAIFTTVASLENWDKLTQKT